MKTQRGFTLIELMVAVAIVGILSAIAWPSYNSYIMRGKIPDATSNLASKRVLMEQYFQDNHTYVGGPACNADSTSSKYFTFSCPLAATATDYVIQAAGTGTMAGFTYTIDQDNNMQTTAAPSGWAAPSMPANCWITKNGGAC
ncbi:fimbrial protein precursor [mine drainage metagenome]|uniref:Fimbrial protein n=1 Tax=mine drainage metagenome TaxID=410659 RepID=A0A1J5R2S5_9ZZZZ